MSQPTTLAWPRPESPDAVEEVAMVTWRTVPLDAGGGRRGRSGKRLIEGPTVICVGVVMRMVDVSGLGGTVNGRVAD